MRDQRIIAGGGRLMTGIEIRRHHANRIKSKVRRFMSRRGIANDARLIGISVGARAGCSKSCCGNPRRHFSQRTLQERRQDADLCFYTTEAEVLATELL